MIIINKVILIGRLAVDPELSFTASGKAVATFRLAVNKLFVKDEADFFNIVVWNNIAENCANYLAKGRLVGVEGRLQTRTYMKDDEKKYITEIVANQVEFLEWGSSKKESRTQKNNTDNEAVNVDIERFLAAEDEEVPF